MKFIKKLQKFLATPPVWFLILVWLAAEVARAWAIVILTQAKFAQYLVLGYVLLGVTVIDFGYVIFGLIRIIPSKRDKMRRNKNDIDTEDSDIDVYEIDD